MGQFYLVPEDLFILINKKKKSRKFIVWPIIITICVFLFWFAIPKVMPSLIFPQPTTLRKKEILDFCQETKKDFPRVKDIQFTIPVGSKDECQINVYIDESTDDYIEPPLAFDIVTSVGNFISSDSFLNLISPDIEVVHVDILDRNVRFEFQSFRHKSQGNNFKTWSGYLWDTTSCITIE